MERILELLNNYMNNTKIKLDELDKNIQYKNKIFDLFKYINYYVHILRKDTTKACVYLEENIETIKSLLSKIDNKSIKDIINNIIECNYLLEKDDDNYYKEYYINNIKEYHKILFDMINGLKLSTNRQKKELIYEKCYYYKLNIIINSINKKKKIDIKYLYFLKNIFSNDKQLKSKDILSLIELLDNNVINNETENSAYTYQELKKIFSIEAPEVTDDKNLNFYLQGYKEKLKQGISAPEIINEIEQDSNLTDENKLTIYKNIINSYYQEIFIIRSLITEDINLILKKDSEEYQDIASVLKEELNRILTELKIFETMLNNRTKEPVSEDPKKIVFFVDGNNKSIFIKELESLLKTYKSKEIYNVLDSFNSFLKGETIIGFEPFNNGCLSGYVTGLCKFKKNKFRIVMYKLKDNNFLILGIFKKHDQVGRADYSRYSDMIKRTSKKEMEKYQEHFEEYYLEDKELFDNILSNILEDLSFKKKK